MSDVPYLTVETDRGYSYSNYIEKLLNKKDSKINLTKIKSPGDQKIG